MDGKTFASNQGDRYLNFKLSIGQEMAGFAITQIVLDEATLFNIAIDPQYQRQGYGRLLLEHLIEQLEARNIVTLWLEFGLQTYGRSPCMKAWGLTKCLCAVTITRVRMGVKMPL